MDNIINPTPKVTTGPLPASAKFYVTPDAAPDLRVPLREIELSSPSEPRVRVYDTTGPYTDTSATIDVSQGLARTRRAGSSNAAASRNMTAADPGRRQRNVKAAALQPFLAHRVRCAASPARPITRSNGLAPASLPRR